MDIGGIEDVRTGSRLLTAEEVADITAHIVRLESENATLREHVKMPDEPLEIDDKDFYTRAFIKWCVETKPGLDRLEAENAKLRELVKHLRECTRHNTCAVCEYADDACDFDYDMRELGIEVSDAS
jgi:hypothetical protein